MLIFYIILVVTILLNNLKLWIKNSNETIALSNAVNNTSVIVACNVLEKYYKLNVHSNLRNVPSIHALLINEWCLFSIILPATSC